MRRCQERAHDSPQKQKQVSASGALKQPFVTLALDSAFQAESRAPAGTKPSALPSAHCSSMPQPKQLEAGWDEGWDDEAGKARVAVEAEGEWGVEMGLGAIVTDMTHTHMYPVPW